MAWPMACPRTAASRAGWRCLRLLLGSERVGNGLADAGGHLLRHQKCPLGHGLGSWGLLVRFFTGHILSRDGMDGAKVEVILVACELAIKWVFVGERAEEPVGAIGTPRFFVGVV